MIFKIFKTEIFVSYLFVAIIIFIIFIDKSGLILPMLISVFIHEITHLLVMAAFGCQPKSVILIPSSIEIKRDICDSFKKEVIISFSGPCSNLLIFVIFFKINIEFSLINLCIGIFNLLPISILDGGEILKIIFSKILSIEKGKNILKIIDIFISVLGIILGAILFFQKNGNFSLIIFSTYILLLSIVKI